MPKRKPVSGTVRLTLTINGTHYWLIPLRPDTRVASKAWRLKKKDGTTYDVSATEFGPVCECGDFIYVRVNQEKKCKHIEALRVLGLT